VGRRVLRLRRHWRCVALGKLGRIFARLGARCRELDGLAVRRVVGGWMLIAVVLRFLWLSTLEAVMRWRGVSTRKLERGRVYVRCCFWRGRWLVDNELEFLRFR
jgi:hypothetical protein